MIFHDVDILPAQIVVPGTTTTALLQQLLPNTDYNVGVVALYSDGEGPALNDAGKTRKFRVPKLPRLHLTDYQIDSSLFLSQCPGVARGISACTTPPPAPCL